MTDDHIHHYVPKGSGLSWWAECDVNVVAPAWSWRPCREKLAGANGPIVGSRALIERAIEARA